MEAVSRYFTELEQMMRAISLAHLERVLRLLEEAYLNGRRIFIMGNGGRPALASHFTPDLAMNTIVPAAPPLQTISRTAHGPLMTAGSIDTPYEHIFQQQSAN